MPHFIITAIVVLAAAKANAQTKGNLTKPKRREKFEGKRGCHLKRGSKKQEDVSLC